MHTPHPSSACEVSTNLLLLGVFCSFSSIAISIYHIWCHSRRNKSAARSNIIRVLAVVPVVAVYSCCKLCFAGRKSLWSDLAHLVKLAYAPVAWISFLNGIIVPFGGLRGLGGTMSQEVDEPLQHMWPLCEYLAPYDPGYNFVVDMVYGIAQYAGMLSFTWFAWCFSFDGNGMFWVATLISSSWAAYCLTYLQRASQAMVNDLKPSRGRFLAMKWIFILPLWQHRLLHMLPHLDIVPGCSTDEQESHAVVDSMDGFLVCIEMLVVAEVHRRAYDIILLESSGARELIQKPMLSSRSAQELVEMQNIDRDRNGSSSTTKFDSDPPNADELSGEMVPDVAGLQQKERKRVAHPAAPAALQPNIAPSRRLSAPMQGVLSEGQLGKGSKLKVPSQVELEMSILSGSVAASGNVDAETQQSNATFGWLFKGFT